MSQRTVERYSISSASSIDSYDFSHYEKENQLPVDLEDCDLNDYENNDITCPRPPEIKVYCIIIGCLDFGVTCEMDYYHKLANAQYVKHARW